MDAGWSQRARRGLARYFERRRWPRITLGLVVILTGLAGFGLSRWLLAAGWTEMWSRYPLAVLGAYLVFLVLLRLWVEIERAQFDANDPEVLAALAEGADEEESGKPALEPGRSRWTDWLDVPQFDSSDSLEGCAFGVLVAVALGLAALLLSMVAAAPALIAEVALDALIVSVLYRRLKGAQREHWLGAAVRGTWWQVLLVAVLLSLAGFALAVVAPGASTLGEAWRILLDRP